MSDCNECINRAKHDWICALDDGRGMWDDLPDDEINGEDCPEFYSHDNAIEQAGCDKFHAEED